MNNNKKLNKALLLRIKNNMEQLIDNLLEMNYHINDIHSEELPKFYEVYISEDDCKKIYHMESLSELEAELNKISELDKIYCCGIDNDLAMWTDDKYLYKLLINTLKKLKSEYSSTILESSSNNIDYTQDTKKYIKEIQNENWSIEHWIDSKLKKYCKKSNWYDNSSSMCYSWRSRHANEDNTMDITLQIHNYNVRDCEIFFNNIKQYKEFTKLKLSKTLEQISFIYSFEKDKDLNDKILKGKQIEEEQIKQYKEDVANADTTKYAPTERDWEKMIGYINRNSNPDRLANSCKDANKIVARYIIARTMKCDNIANAFRQRALDMNICTAAELEAYANKYATYNIPEEYQMLIDDLKSNDVKGGLSKLNNEANNILHKSIIKSLYDNPDVIDYNIELIDLKIEYRRNRYNYVDLQQAILHIITRNSTPLDIYIGYSAANKYVVNNIMMKIVWQLYTSSEIIQDINYYIKKHLNK